MRAKSARYVLVGEEQYMKGYSQLLLKFVTRGQAQCIMKEMHTRIC